MADNVTANSGSGGAVFATDDISSVHYPRAKLVWGVDGVATDASASNPLPVVQTGTPTLPSGASTLAEQQSQTTALQLIDDAVVADDAAFTPGTTKVIMAGATFDDTTPDSVNEGDAGALRMSANRNLFATLRDAAGNERGVNVTAGNALTVDGSATTQPVSAASLPLPSGASTAANQSTANTALAAIQTAVELIDNTVGGTELQVDVVAALPAGTNAIGKLAANSGVDIGDVDVTSVVPGTGASNLGKAEDGAHTSGDVGVMSLAVRNDVRASLAGTDLDYAPLQLNSSGDVRVDGSAVTQPISASSLPLPSGAATAANQSTGNTSLSAIQTAVEVLDNAISGSEMQVDVVASLPAGTNNIGDVDVLSVVPGTGATSLGKAEDAGHTTGDTGVMALAVRNDSRASLAGTDLDYAPLQLNSSGDLRVDGSAVTQPVSAASLPLPSGAATSANQSTANTALSAIQTAVEVIDNAISGSEMQVDVVAALPAGTNAIGKLAANSGVDIGDVDVTSISAGANLIGDVGISGARTSGGTTIFRSLDLDETEEDVKTSAGQVYWIHAMNVATTKRYLKFYNATAANVTVGTTTPVLTFILPTQGDANGAGFTLSIPNGIAFSTAICVAATTGLADNDTGAPGANDVIVNIGYA